MEYGKNLEQLFEELGADKLEQQPPRTVLEPEAVEDEPNINEHEAEVDEFADIEEDEEPNIKDLSGLPELIVGIIDIFAATVAEAWTQTDDKAKYRLQEDEKEELVKAWKLYLKNSPDVKISPSTMLLLTTVIIYAPKTIMAISERKERKEREWQQQEEL
ncbi:MAG: hypothetical protein SPL14_07595 [Candidatus Onthomorpha sp.]|nr:hypothetical protein [Bacteroidales bacterium]MDD7484544.1 hypothetical protein [Bacteroidales bacterium]MDY5699274.1 hypothetical protein [Candidatus Onthomorpha sp.]